MARKVDDSPVTSLPTGTVTMLFSDIEGSTALLSRLGDRYADTLDVQRDLLRSVWRRYRGIELGTEGDSFYVVFELARDAVAAAVDAQRALTAQDWPGGEQVGRADGPAHGRARCARRRLRRHRRAPGRQGERIGPRRPGRHHRGDRRASRRQLARRVRTHRPRLAPAQGLRRAAAGLPGDDRGAPPPVPAAEEPGHDLKPAGRQHSAAGQARRAPRPAGAASPPGTPAHAHRHRRIGQDETRHGTSRLARGVLPRRRVLRAARRCHHQGQHVGSHRRRARRRRRVP